MCAPLLLVNSFLVHVTRLQVDNALAFVSVIESAKTSVLVLHLASSEATGRAPPCSRVGSRRFLAGFRFGEQRLWCARAYSLVLTKVSV